MKLPKIFYNPIFIGVFILVLIIAGFVVYFLYRTTFYINYLKNCPSEPSKNFCYIKVFDLPLPKDYVAPLLLISQEEGKRIEIIKKRHLTQVEAAELLGLSQLQLAGLLRGQFRCVSETKILEYLNRLGRDEQIVIRRRSRYQEDGHTSVVFS
jgi:predicted XRE-type DNA-binding protein